jgi:hypothetical protein
VVRPGSSCGRAVQLARSHQGKAEQRLQADGEVEVPVSAVREARLSRPSTTTTLPMDELQVPPRSPCPCCGSHPRRRRGSASVVLVLSALGQLVLLDRLDDVGCSCRPWRWPGRWRSSIACHERRH